MIKNISYALDLLFNRTKNIDMKRMGMNAFFNTNIFTPKGGLGEIQSQFADIAMNVKTTNIRILLNWNDSIQKNIKSKPNFSFYDTIFQTCYDNYKLIPVINGCPTWNKDSDTTKNLNNFLEKWVFPCLERYGHSEKVLGFQIGNEINTAMFHDNTVYGFVNSPEIYVNVFGAIRKQIDPSIKLISSPTTSIIQNYPNTLKYNKTLRSLQIDEIADYYAFNYYGNSIIPACWFGGAIDFLNSLKCPVICTEFGSDNPSKHVDYFFKYGSFFQKNIKKLELTCWYQYDGSGSTASYGLHMGDGAVSPLYDLLKNGQKM